MQAAHAPFAQDVVLVGGGHAHALLLRAWGMRPVAGARLTLIDPGPVAAYSGMLPGHVAGHYPRAALELELVRLARFAGARLVLGAVTAVDPVAREVTVPGRPPIRYDLLSLDVGVTSGMDVPGFADHAVPAKPLGPFAAAWAAHAQGKAGPAVVIGGGVAGLELAMAMAFRLGPGRVTVVEAGPRVVPELPQAGRARILRAARDLGLTVRTGARAARVTADHVALEDGTLLPSAFTAGVAVARPQPFVAGIGLPHENGFLTVGPTLASVADPRVFAVGDCAHLGFAPRPKAGVYAVRQAPVLFDNLRAALTGGALRPYRPQGDYLKLISLGGRDAVAHRGGLTLAHPLIWRWKDRIDRAFMTRLSDLPAPEDKAPPMMATGAETEAQPLCGGCAAKVGRGALAAAMPALAGPSRADVLQGAGDDAAVLSLGGVAQVLTVDTLRAFTDDPWLLARIAAVHALGDVWAMGAAPQAALASFTLPRMIARLQTATLREMMAAASDVFGAEGAAIIGGHSALGAELSAGYTVTGLCDRPIGQGGARVGDVLILTKPLGTGVILAAEMAMRAPGPVVAAALASMQRPQGVAARLLAGQATAMTDVTGFGLAGHLIGMLEASSRAARLDLSALPVLPGAEALLAAGQRSSLHVANAALRDRCLVQGPRVDLLFDPQTAGGLLAAVPEPQAPVLLARLRDAGFDAAMIGQVEDGPPIIR